MREKWPFIKEEEADEDRRAEIKRLEKIANENFESQEDKIRDWQGKIHFSS